MARILNPRPLTEVSSALFVARLLLKGACDTDWTGPHGTIIASTQPASCAEMLNIELPRIVTAQPEPFPHGLYDYCTANFLTQAGVKNTHLYLASVDSHGNAIWKCSR